MHVTDLRLEHIGAVAHLHARSLAGDFLPTLGEAFLRVFYRTALKEGLAFGFVYLVDGKPAGFVLGSQETGRLFRGVILKSAFSLGWAALPAILRRPGLLVKVAESFLYPRREGKVTERAELLVIAVDADQREQGIGEALVQALNKAFCERGVASYKVTVLQSNQGANHFYQRMGFKLAGDFQLYRQGWNIYTFMVKLYSP